MQLEIWANAEAEKNTKEEEPPKKKKSSGIVVIQFSRINGGRGGRDWLRGGAGGRIQRGGCRPRQEEETLLQGAPVHDVRIWRRPEPVHGVGGYSGGSGDRVHHGNDPQSHVHRAPGPRPGGGHRFSNSQGSQKVRQSQRPPDHERGAEESPESFR